jgi:hypothetical protein
VKEIERLLSVCHLSSQGAAHSAPPWTPPSPRRLRQTIRTPVFARNPQPQDFTLAQRWAGISFPINLPKAADHHISGLFIWAFGRLGKSLRRGGSASRSVGMRLLAAAHFLRSAAIGRPFLGPGQPSAELRAARGQRSRSDRNAATKGPRAFGTGRLLTRRCCAQKQAPGPSLQTSPTSGYDAFSALTMPPASLPGRCHRAMPMPLLPHP